MSIKYSQVNISSVQWILTVSGWSWFYLGATTQECLLPTWTELTPSHAFTHEGLFTLIQIHWKTSLMRHIFFLFNLCILFSAKQLKNFHQHLVQTWHIVRLGLSAGWSFVLSPPNFLVFYFSQSHNTGVVNNSWQFYQKDSGFSISCDHFNPSPKVWVIISMGICQPTTFSSSLSSLTAFSGIFWCLQCEFSELTCTRWHCIPANK